MSFENVVVAGGGVLGSQIAFQTAYKGKNVKIWLRSEGSIGRTQPKLDRLRGMYLDMLENLKTDKVNYPRGLVDDPNLTDEQIDELKQQVENAYNNIVLTTDYDEAAKDADLVIESIAEIPEEKIAFYTELAKHLPEDTVIATNSSTMLPSQFAEYTGRPEKYLALHFANEIWTNNTGEVMGHAGTGEEAFKAVSEFAGEIGMVPLEVLKEQPGYILNSLLIPFLMAAQSLAATGVAEPETIDMTWKLGTGAPQGPFQIIDIIGLTTPYNITSAMPEAQDPNHPYAKVVEMLKKMIDEGKTGINAGEGFYKYN
jgi:3-hydroxybutyryl-CoA dehydrogenase